MILPLASGIGRRLLPQAEALPDFLGSIPAMARGRGRPPARDRFSRELVRHPRLDNSSRASQALEHRSALREAMRSSVRRPGLRASLFASSQREAPSRQSLCLRRVPRCQPWRPAFAHSSAAPPGQGHRAEQGGGGALSYLVSKTWAGGMGLLFGEYPSNQRTFIAGAPSAQATDERGVVKV